MMFCSNRHYHCAYTKVFKIFISAAVLGILWYSFNSSDLFGFNDAEIVKNSILKEKSFELPIKQLQTDSGIQFWLAEEHSVPIVSLDFMIAHAGRAYDPEGKNGRAAVAAELMNYGAGEFDRVQFQEILELNGIALNFSVDDEDFYGSMAVPFENLEKGVALLNSALTKPRFYFKDLRLSQIQRLEMLKMQQEHPEKVLSIEFFKNLYGNHPYARNPLGDEKGLKALRTTDLHDYLQENIALDNIIIGVAGDIDEETAKKVVAQAFEGLPLKNQNNDIDAPVLNLEPATNHIERTAAQVSSRFAAKGTTRNAGDFYPLYIANHIFGGSGLTSRLSLRSREKEGLTYGVYTYLSAEDKVPLILGQFSSTPENYEAMKHIILDEWQKMAVEGVTNEEFETAKKYLLASYTLRFDSTAGLSSMLVSIQKYNLGADFLQNRNDYIRKVSLGDVNRAAAKYFSSLPVELSIGHLENKKQNKKKELNK